MLRTLTRPIAAPLEEFSIFRVGGIGQFNIFGTNLLRSRFYERIFSEINWDFDLSSGDLVSKNQITENKPLYLPFINPFFTRLVSRVGRGETRTINGEDNNKVFTSWGSKGDTQLSIFDANYLDGFSLPKGLMGDLPNPRLISNTVLVQGENTPLSVNNNLLWAWGQFLDHDFIETPVGGGFLPIPVPQGDEFFDPDGTGLEMIPFDRMLAADGTGTPGNPRLPINEITAFIDASTVYGSEEELAHDLRTNDGSGKMRSEINLLGEETMPLSEDLSRVSGDVRALENPVLAAVHDLFRSEHNRVVDLVREKYEGLDFQARILVNQFRKPGMTLGDAYYEIGRKYVGALTQMITYNEFLPMLVGEGRISEYSGYKPYVNPQITTEFQTAAYRVGHTMIPDELKFLLENGDEISSPLLAGFFNPDILNSVGKEAILAGALNSQMNEIDPEITDTLRNILFGANLDLASLNIARGRDAGNVSYADAHEALGFGEIDGFDDITGDTQRQANLQAAYGDVDDVDLWVGILSADKLTGSMLDPVGTAIIVDQFERLRDGDRFYYENDKNVDSIFSLLDASESSQTLGEVIENNTDIIAGDMDIFMYQPEVDFV